MYHRRRQSKSAWRNLWRVNWDISHFLLTQAARLFTQHFEYKSPEKGQLGVFLELTEYDKGGSQSFQRSVEANISSMTELCLAFGKLLERQEKQIIRSSLTFLFRFGTLFHPSSMRALERRKNYSFVLAQICQISQESIYEAVSTIKLCTMYSVADECGSFRKVSTHCTKGRT